MTEVASQSYHHGDLRRALIEAAMGLLDEGGGWQFTLREVARRAGVSHAAPYRHFPDKAALLTELAGAGFDALGQALSAAVSTAPGSVEKQFVSAAKAYIEFGTSKPALYQLMFSADSGEEHQVHLGERAMNTLQMLKLLLGQGQQEGVFKTRPIAGQAAACWSQVHGLTMLAINGLLLPEKVGENPVDDALTVLFEGLAA